MCSTCITVNNSTNILIPFNNVSFNIGEESMDTVGEYFINNDYIKKIIKYLCYAEPYVPFGEFVIDSRNKYICACPSGMLMALGIV